MLAESKPTKTELSEWKRSIIESAARSALPIMTYPGLALTGRNIIDAVTNPEHQLACIERIAERYPSLAAVTMMDLSAEAEAFGTQVRFSDTEVPTAIGALVTDMASAEALRVPKPGERRTSVYLKVAELAAARIADRPVFACHIGPFSLAARLCDLKTIMLAVRLQPPLVHAVLGKCVEFLTAYALAFKAAGANGVIMAEPAAGLLSPKQCDEFSSAYVRRIVEAVQDDGFMVILHNCGNTAQLVKSMLSTGAAGLHFSNTVSLCDVAAQMPPDRLVLGNIEPAELFCFGSPDLMESRVRSLLEEMQGFPNFVLSSGCDVPPGSPLANIDAFFATLDQYNAQRLPRAM